MDKFEVFKKVGEGKDVYLKDEQENCMMKCFIDGERVGVMLKYEGKNRIELTSETPTSTTLCVSRTKAQRRCTMRFDAFTAMDIIRDFYKGKSDLNGVPSFTPPFNVGWRVIIAKFENRKLEGLGIAGRLFMCGLLHDLVEDRQDSHEWTFQRLKSMGCPKDVLHSAGTPYA